MSLPDQNTGMMNTLGKTQFVDTGLETSLQEILHLERQHVIELHAGFVEHTDTNETANQGIALEETLRVFFFHGEKHTTGSISSRAKKCLQEQKKQEQS